MPPRTRTTTAEAPDTQEVPAADDSAQVDMCAEHFPVGWKSPIVRYTEERLGHPQPSVTCEHGTYYRPVEKADAAPKDDEVAALNARIAELEAAAAGGSTP